MQYCIYSPLSCLSFCRVTSVNQGSLWVRKKGHWPALSSNTDLHRQAGLTPRWLGDIQLLYAAYLPDSSISLLLCPHLSLSEFKDFCLAPPQLHRLHSSVLSDSFFFLQPLLFVIWSLVCFRLFSFTCTAYHNQHKKVWSTQPHCCLTPFAAPYWCGMVTAASSGLCFWFFPPEML